MFKRKKDEILDEYDEFEYEEYEQETDEYLEEYLEEQTNEQIEELDGLDEYEEKPKNNRKKIKLIMNIIFIIIMLSLTMIAVDVICVSRYNKGPYFAIPTKTYKDGGTKEYYGLGYKVIKYNQIQGRRDMEIGKWDMPYSVEPIDLSDLDLAIEFTEKPADSYEKYYKKFVRIDSTLKKVLPEKNKLLLTYEDEGEKYTLEIICTMANKKSNIDQLEKDKEITIIGTVTNFEIKNQKNNNKLHISNCFAEQ